MGCLTPFSRKHNKINIDLPCGKCINCKTARISGWSFRITKQAEISDFCNFLTLTYANHKLRRTRDNLRTISKVSIQSFLKRLRKNSPNSKFKYYAVGEYGSQTGRPHYHVILLTKDKNLTERNLERLIKKSWILGYTHIGKATPASISYTLKYISKPAAIPSDTMGDCEKEFSLMSKGMGSNYLTKAMVKWHLADLENRMYIPLKDNGKIQMPRYYKMKIYTKKQRRSISSYFSDPDEYRSMVETFPLITEAERKAWLKRLTLETPYVSWEDFLQEEKIRINLVEKSNRSTRLDPKI